MSTSLSGLSTNFFPSAQNGFTTTLASTISSGAATVPLNSVAGYTNGQIAVFVVDPSDVTKKQTFTGVIDTSGVQVTSVVWTAGTNQSHSGGATVVDYATATHISMVTKGITQQHTQAGAHGAVTATSLSTSGNITSTGSVTAGSSLNMSAGTFSLTGVWDGWIGGDTFVYVSANSFKITGTDVTTKYPIGTKIKLTQTTPKYFYVTNVAFSTDTTVTVYAGSDYTLANAAITAPFYSHAVTPQLFPSVFNCPANAGTAGGDMFFIMEGKVKKLFGTSATQSISAGGASALTVTFPSSTFNAAPIWVSSIGRNMVGASLQLVYPDGTPTSSSLTLQFYNGSGAPGTGLKGAWEARAL